MDKCETCLHEWKTKPYGIHACGRDYMENQFVPLTAWRRLWVTLFGCIHHEAESEGEG